MAKKKVVPSGEPESLEKKIEKELTKMFDSNDPPDVGRLNLIKVSVSFILMQDARKDDGYGAGLKDPEEE